jgi:peptide subunit release factor 1 (eRF1)
MSRYEIPPERLERWLDRWAAAHAPVVRTLGGVVFESASEIAECAPPFPPVEARAEVEGFAPQALLAHVARERRVGVLLVRLGGAAAGVFRGDELVDSKVETRLVHGRHRKGGSSARRFERRREGQARVALQAAADVAVRVIVPALAELDGVVLGGDRRALATVLEDPRLAQVRERAQERVLEVADPRLDVLRATPEGFRSTIIEVVQPGERGGGARGAPPGSA